MNKLPDIIEFCNLKTRLRFQAQTNFNKKDADLNSITFYYQMLLPTKIHLEPSDNFYNVLDRFESIILGEVYGGVLLGKYPLEDGVKTYLIYDGRNYKIGKSKDPNKRLKELRTGNPNIDIVATSELIPERFLHEVFAHRNVGGEWFNLLSSEIEVITKMMSIKNLISANALMRMCHRQIRRNKPSRSETKVVNVIKEKRKEIASYDKAKFTFGKYSGTLVKDMMSVDQRKYLFWAYHNMGNLNKVLKSAIKIQLGI